MFIFLFLLNFFLAYTNCSTQKSFQSFNSTSLNLRLLDDGLDPKPEKDITKIYNFSCKEEDGKSPCVVDHFSCIDEAKTICNCTNEYANDANKGTDKPYKCTYERKKQLTAFLLELFVGFGAGHFYRANYLEASLKLVAFLLGIYIICLFPITAKCAADCCDCDCLVVLVSLFWFLISVGLAFWFIFDLVLFGKNKYKDPYGFCLAYWKTGPNPCVDGN